MVFDIACNHTQENFWFCISVLTPLAIYSLILQLHETCRVGVCTIIISYMFIFTISGTDVTTATKTLLKTFKRNIMYCLCL